VTTLRFRAPFPGIASQVHVALDGEADASALIVEDIDLGARLNASQRVHLYRHVTVSDFSVDAA
jgi:hypothetical protein